MEQETRIAVVGIIVEDKEAVGEITITARILSEEWDFRTRRSK